MTLNWEQWRHDYNNLTYQQQEDFHTLIHQQHPNQNHYNAGLAQAAIKHTNPRHIVELGGWDGALAHEMLDIFPNIRTWTNIEICKQASEAGLNNSRHPHRYYAYQLTKYYWEFKYWNADLFVASHVIEHLSAEHLDATIAATIAPHIYLDAPLHDHPTNWKNFTGTHTLETGWDGVNEILSKHGYKTVWAIPHDTPPETGGHARACLYTKR